MGLPGLTHSQRLLAALLMVLVGCSGLSGCSHLRGGYAHLPDVDDGGGPPLTPRARRFLGKVLLVGQSMLGDQNVSYQGRSYRPDCSGFVEACYSEAGGEVLPSRPRGRSGTQIIFNGLADQGRVRRTGPRSGDLVFFHNTWDRNSNGRLDDRFTHVGIVESVRTDGTVVFLHRASGQVKRGYMNLSNPSVHRAAGSDLIQNDWLRRRRDGDRRGTPYTTAQCFHAFGRPAIPRDVRRQGGRVLALLEKIEGREQLPGSGYLPSESLQSSSSSHEW